MFQKKEHHGTGIYFVQALAWGVKKTGFAYFKDLRRIEERISNLQQTKGKKGASWG
jgi:hypothetical protein